MYLALYRKWRPKTFSDVFGQDMITEILKREVKQNTVSHAYLFCGLRGTGKTTCAKILAKAVNCEHPEDGEPCGKCENCLAADRGALLDIVEIDAASNNGVDNIRSVIEEVSFLPSQGKRKVYIIDEVHMLSGGAFNALLKTLEEPPEHVLFILCTTETHKIPATILSRCQRFDFGRIDAQNIVKRLEYIAKEENMQIEPDAAALIARLAEGAMRDALSLFELCAGHTNKIDYELACKLLGVPDRDKMHNLCACFVSGDSSGALDIINSMLSTGKAATICSEMIEFFRDMLIITTAAAPEKLIIELPEEIAKCKATAARFTKSRLLYSMGVLEKCMYTLPQANVNERTTLEMAVIRLCNIEKTADIEALFARVEALERGALPIKSEIKAISENKPAPVVQKKEAPAAEPREESKKESAEAESTVSKAFDDWGEFIDAVSREDKVARSFVSLGRGFIKGDILEIVLEDSMSAAMLNKQTRLAILKKAASEVLGRAVDVIVTVKKTEKSQSGLLD